MSVLSQHIKRKHSWKTVCVSECLHNIGISIDSFYSTWTRKNPSAWKGVIRRNGFALRSRLSLMGKRPTVGSVRSKVAKLSDGPNTKYIVVVDGHMLLLNSNGETIVDTSPRKRDRRGVLMLYAVWPK
ncbi:MAG: hypothetical protein DWQ49_09460 [Bacteroidetes bacterium]|nr:MAG: hypothetical protein DWQ49_09460 [Bacteroidota bacterium]